MGKGATGAVGALALAVASAAIFLFTLFLMDRGVELTDEGYYFNSASTPELYIYNVTLFGRMLHPLLLAVDHNITLFRAINLIAMVACQLAIVLQIFRLLGDRLPLGRIEKWGIGGAFTVSALLFYCIWLPTPNYNSLNVVGASLFASAAIGWQRDRNLPAQLGDIVVAGVGLAICALVKATTGALMIPLVMLAGFISLRRGIMFTAGVGLVSALAFAGYLLVAVGPPDAILKNYAGNISITGEVLGWSLASVEHYLWRSLPFIAEMVLIGVVVCLSPVLYLAMIGQPRNLVARIGIQVLVFAAITAVCVWVQLHPNTWNRAPNWTAGLAALCMLACHALRRRDAVDGAMASLAIVLLLIPFAVGFGSNTGMTRSAGQAGAIWTAGSMLTVAILMRGEILRAAVWRLGILAVLSTAVVIGWATHFPQRQSAPLLTQNTPVGVRDGRHTLRVDEPSAAYFNSLTSAARQAGFTLGTPVVDFTGTSPGTIYMMGGEALGWAYISGGYPGSQKLLEQALANSAPADVQRAWLLVADKGTSPDALKAHGRVFPDDYELVARAQPSTGYPEQTLWRPRPKAAGN